MLLSFFWGEMIPASLVGQIHVRREYFIALILLLVTLGLFGRAVSFDFVGYDDPSYVSENEIVKEGITSRSVQWALTSVSVGNYHPLTSLSHVLDVELFGLNPGAHHGVNAALHAVNAALLFLLLRLGTGSLWRSALVATLFAWHPLRVESVAWISERKDVLSGLFFFLTLLAYVGYAHRVQQAREGFRSRYILALVAFTLGLASKPMLVTVPFLLLLLDFWPLERISWPPSRHWRKLVLEKIPFLALSGLFSFLAFHAQKSWGAMDMTAPIRMWERFQNAILSYWSYLQKFFVPVHLAPIYPHPSAGYEGLQALSGWWVLVLGVGLVVVSAVAFRFALHKRYAFTGWFWYMGLLVPVIGLIQVGEQAMADRYTYLPMIGFTLVLVWGTAELADRWRVPNGYRAAVSGILLAFCVVLTYRQLGHWRNTISLFEHTLEVTRSNPSAHFGLGLGLERAGDLDAAEAEYRKAIGLWSENWRPWYNLGQLSRKRGEWAKAEELFRKAAELSPRSLDALLNLAGALQQQGKNKEAVEYYERALNQEPSSVEALNNLTWLLATERDPALRDPVRAVELGQRACQASGFRLPRVIGTLAAAYAEAGLFAEATAMAERACEVAARTGDMDALTQNRHLQERYRAGRKYTDPE